MQGIARAGARLRHFGLRGQHFLPGQETIAARQVTRFHAALYVLVQVFEVVQVALFFGQHFVRGSRFPQAQPHLAGDLEPRAVALRLDILTGTGSKLLPRRRLARQQHRRGDRHLGFAQATVVEPAVGAVGQAQHGRAGQPRLCDVMGGSRFLLARSERGDGNRLLPGLLDDGVQGGACHRWQGITYQGAGKQCRQAQGAHENSFGE
ncbi:hypothetical protein DUPY_52660 [Duganella phyllosphaerae]|uniref:Uncharacterized protein n=1 Tax=Duganella phyllosphaerae TaxID=762836 RepID=A0A1E7W5V7_9BURK|nr:hypothetical protein DUPY_52660 [Duganella phyllosphaerae]